MNGEMDFDSEERFPQGMVLYGTLNSSYPFDHESARSET